MNQKLGALWLLAALTYGCGDDSDTTAAGGAGGHADTGGATTGGAAAGGAAAGGAAAGGEASCFGTDAGDPTLLASLDAIRSFMAAHDIPGGAAIAIAKDGKSVGFGATGSKTEPACDPITVDTLMLATSASDLITAIAALDAVEDGELSLSEPITTVVPTLDTAPSPHGTVDDITLHHLLTFTSGYRAISDQWFTFNTCTTLEDSINNPDVPLLYWPPGTMHSPFIRSNIEIAGMALQNVDKVPFAQVARTRVLEPLGMGGLYDKAEVEASDHAFGHFNANGDEPVEGCANRHPSDGYYGSVRDMSKLLELLTGGAPGVLEPASLERMLSPQGVNFWKVDYTSYGFDDGWHDGTTGADVFFNSSFLNGNLQMTMVFADRDLAITLMMNSSAVELAQPVDLTPLVNQLLVISDATLEGFQFLPTHTPTAEDLSAALGTYRDEIGFNGEGWREITISLADDGLSLIGELTTADEDNVQSVDLTGLLCTDNYSVEPSAHDQVARFWRDTNDETYAISFGYDGGPPFFRVESP